MTICILGRQPELGLAELESLYGSENVTRLGNESALVKADVDFARLGGSIKTANLLATLPGHTLRSGFQKISSLLPGLVKTMPEGKIKLGISLYGYDMRPYDLNGESLRLKKTIKHAGRSVRVVPNESPALSSAQTYHNSLTSELGLEFVVIKGAEHTYIGRVTHVQNIDAYRIRDRERPKRDAFVGMLPPKLAQIIVNLAIGDSPKIQNPKSKISSPTAPTVLDPFCGTGVILQEALLMGLNAYGTDISPKMIDYTRTNLDWLRDKKKIAGSDHLAVADATMFSWDLSNISGLTSNICVACEGYLGQPLGGQSPTEEKIQQIVHDTNTVMRGFLKNVGPQLGLGTRLCIAMPAWFVGDATYHLPVIDELESLGFSRTTFSHAPDLIYRREDQVTARELIVLVKK